MALASWEAAQKGSTFHRFTGMKRSPARTLGTIGRAIQDVRSDRGSQSGPRKGPRRAPQEDSQKGSQKGFFRRFLVFYA